MATHTVAEAAKIVRKSQDTIYRRIKKGKLSANKDAAGNSVIETTELARVFGALHNVASAPANPDAEKSEQMQLQESQVLREVRSQLMTANARIVELTREVQEGKEREADYRATIAIFRGQLLPAPNHTPQSKQAKSDADGLGSVDVEGMFRPKKKGKKKKGKKK